MTGQAWGATDIGQRDEQQDAFHLDADAGLLVIADGMGGHSGGALAAQAAVDAIVSEIDPATCTRDDLEEVFGWAARCVKDASAGGTTLVVAVVSRERASIAWAGDSSAFLVREGKVEQLTDPHVEGGGLNRSLPHEPWPDVVDIDLFSGDLLVLCSDGVTDVLSSEDLAFLANDVSSPAEELVWLATDAGTSDNCTAIVWSHS